MSGTIWLIVEDENDAEIVSAILKKKAFPIRVEPVKPTGGSGGISRVAEQLKQLIAAIRVNKHFKQEQDCIAVLHDQDIQKQQQNRAHYQRIRDTCRSQGIKLVIAIDELEAWVLADSGVCEWLQESPRNWDEQQKPSDTLRSLLMSKHKIKYQGRYRQRVWEHMRGDGDTRSPSMRTALEQLNNAPCMRANPQ